MTEEYIPRFPKPGMVPMVRETIRILSDGREIIRRSTAAGQRIYKHRVAIMWSRQLGMCGLQISPRCPKKIRLHEATFEHCAGRGMGGGKRDDRVVVNGKPQNLAVCEFCNTLKGSRSLEAVKGLPDASREA